VRRKRPIKVFSGPTTGDLGALDACLSEAALVRVYRGGYLVYAVRAEDDVLAPETEKWVSILSDEPISTTSDPGEITDLRVALEVAELQNFVCMCPGDLAFEFLDEQKRPVEVVRFDYPDTIEWTSWEGKARLTNPATILAWLERRKVTAGR
jgi:hypothetical protein